MLQVACCTERIGHQLDDAVDRLAEDKADHARVVGLHVLLEHAAAMLVRRHLEDFAY